MYIINIKTNVLKHSLYSSSFSPTTQSQKAKDTSAVSHMVVLFLLVYNSFV